MTLPLAIDYAWSHPSPAAIKAAGHTAVGRYLSYDSTKNLTVAERDGLLAEGLDIFLVWENGAADALQGATEGTHEAEDALSMMAALGCPDGMALYFAVDTATNDYAAIDDYFAAAAQVIAGTRDLGGYGDYDVCTQLYGSHRISLVWQTLAWSAGAVMGTNLDLYQRAGQVSIDGVTCDVNEIHNSYYGGWNQTMGLSAADKTFISDLISEQTKQLNGSFGVIESGSAVSPGHVGLRDVEATAQKILTAQTGDATPAALEAAVTAAIKAYVAGMPH